MASGSLVWFLLPKISSFFSMMGSAMIISAVLRDKKNRRNPLKRILLGMSVIDVLVSSQWLFVNFFMPPWGTMEWAFGNYRTCVFQGVICQFNSASGFYNTMLAICYLLMIVFDWSEKKIKNIEPLLHFFPLAWGFCTTVTGLVLDLYHPAGIDCWIAVCPEDAIETYPGAPDCATMWKWNLSQITLFRLAMFHGPVMFYCFLITAIMVVIYFKVKRIEVRSAKYGAASAGAEQELKRTKHVLWQGILYAGGFFMTWVLIVLVRLLQFGGVSIPQPLGAMAAFFIAFQGLLNALTFFRPMYTQFRRQNPEVWSIHVASMIVLDQFFFCCRDTIPFDGKGRQNQTRNQKKKPKNQRKWFSPLNILQSTLASLAAERLSQDETAQDEMHVSCLEEAQAEEKFHDESIFYSARQAESQDQMVSSCIQETALQDQERRGKESKLLNELKKTIPVRIN